MSGAAKAEGRKGRRGHTSGKERGRPLSRAAVTNVKLFIEYVSRGE